MNQSEQIQELVERMLTVAPETFKHTEENKTINIKIKESIGLLTSLVTSLGYVKHGTQGGRKKFAKDLAATFLVLFEFLPLLDKYKELTTLTDLIDKRLKDKEVKKRVVYIKFGKVSTLNYCIYAARVSYDNGDYFVTSLNNDMFDVITNEQVTKTFVEVKQNSRHSKINARYALLYQSIEQGWLKVKGNKLDLGFKTNAA
jgi:hypothetical protein